MAYRKKMSRKKSKKDFTKKAMKVSRKNMAAPMRGGIRL